MTRKPTPLFVDPVEKHIAGMRTLLGMIQGAAAARDCPSTREAIEEMEERGEVGCPLCGGPAVLHRGEVSV
jgi:hypothetical protein